MYLEDLRINNMVFIYFPLVRAIEEHDKIIKLSGGSTGLLHRHLLESTLDFIQNDDYYPECR